MTASELKKIDIDPKNYGKVRPKKTQKKGEKKKILQHRNTRPAGGKEEKRQKKKEKRQLWARFVLDR